MEQIEKVVRLIRSKGVGVYFITQNPMDIPEDILGQLGNKVQHALRAFTPKDQKAVKAVSQTFRKNDSFDTEKAILELETGEALISFLDEKGAPSVVERAKMLCPQGQIGPLTAEERKEAIESSALYGVYEKVRDRESAYEILQEEEARRKREEARLEEEKKREMEREKEEKASRNSKKSSSKSSAKTSSSPLWNLAAKVLTSVGRSLGTALINKLTKKR
jgi:DNA helicase HerA-like ATPase